MRRCALRWFRLAAQAAGHIDERFTPAGKWLLSIAGFAGVFSADPERTHAWLLFTSTTSLLAASLLASMLWRPRLSARRIMPSHVTALSATSYVIALSNDGATDEPGIAVADRLRQAWPSAEMFATDEDGDSSDNWFDRRVGFRRWQRMNRRLQGATLPALDIDELPRRAEIRVAVPLTPLRRGWLEFERLRVKKPDPLGLCYAIRELALPDRLLSRPPCMPVGAFALPAGRASDTASTSCRARGDGQEFFALRDYRPGDPLRLVDWRASARRRLPVVRQFAATAARPPLLLLDASAAPGRTQDFETMLVVASSLLFAAAGRPHASMALAIVRNHDAPPVVSASADALDCLALLAPAAGDLFDSCAAALAHAAGERPVLLITAHWDARRVALARTLATCPGATILACDSRGEVDECARTLILRDGLRALPSLAGRLAALSAAGAKAR
jgi:uncharacterized protein (DUF58 family)